MLTDEQLKNLKYGDPVIIHGTFERMAADGDICVKFPMSLRGFVDNNHIKCAHRSAVSIGKHRYDPCRRFREGDRVSPCAWQDRAPTARMGECCIIPKPGTYEVLTDELHEMVSLRYGEDTIKMHICFLELVTPVEELEPYHVVQTTSENAFEICRMKNEKHIVRMCYFYEEGIHEGEESWCHAELTESEAKAAAEAECERLNEEWRKEHNL